MDSSLLGGILKRFGLLSILFVAQLVFGQMALAQVSVGQKTQSCSSAFIDQRASLPQRTLKDDAKVLSVVRQEIQDARNISHTLQDYFIAKSDQLAKLYSGKTVVLDYLCIGGGPQCADASLVLGRTKNRSLVIERSNNIARVFAEKDFYINSTEDVALTMHEFPGAYGSLANLSSQQYSHSSQLAAFIQSQQKFSQVNVLLDQNVTGFKRVVEGSQTYFYVFTESGLKFKVKNLIVGTGLGEIQTKVADAIYKKDFASHLEKALQTNTEIQKISSTDSFLIALKNRMESGLPISLPQKIIIVGNGDGARIVLESIKLYNITLPKDFQIVWVGNPAKNEVEFVESMRGWPRYIKLISEFYRDGMIKGVPGHISAYSKATDGTITMTSEDQDTHQSYSFSGSMVIDSTGYTPVTNELLKQIGASDTIVDFKGKLDGSELTSLGRQAQLASGELLNVFFVGSAAGVLATKEELAGKPNRIGVSLYNTLGRTSRLLSQITNTEPLPTRFGVRTARPPMKSAQEWLKGLGF